MALRAGTGVSRGHSTGSNEPEDQTGRTHNSGRAELGRQTRPSVVLSGAMRPNRLSYRQRSSWQRKRAASFPRTARNPDSYQGPACTVVWEAGGETLRATRLVVIISLTPAPLKRSVLVTQPLRSPSSQLQMHRVGQCESQGTH